MSELVPEVGDLWVDSKTEKEKVHVFGIYKNGYGEYVCYGIYDPIYMEMDYNNIGLKLFLRGFKYLGKSKANINQLFEVQDDKSQRKN